MKLNQMESPELLTDTVISQTVRLNVLFPNNYRYYFDLVSNTEEPVLIDHPFRLYFPSTVTVVNAPSGGVYIILESSPEFVPFGLLTVQVYFTQEIYNAIVTAIQSPISS